jgi:hypothetical protein
MQFKVLSLLFGIVAAWTCQSAIAADATRGFFDAGVVTFVSGTTNGDATPMSRAGCHHAGFRVCFYGCYDRFWKEGAPTKTHRLDRCIDACERYCSKCTDAEEIACHVVE